jgi:hypothetical protein
MNSLPLRVNGNIWQQQGSKNIKVSPEGGCEKRLARYHGR